ncbi:MAG: anti-sigma factor antagonist [Clostridia bacterium]|nr:anti-sigma factor antagonist [Clostridia bacterium]
MQINSMIQNKTLYISLTGELDEYTAAYCRNELDNAFNIIGYNQIVLDLSKLTFMDSTGIGMLIGRYKKVRQLKKQIYISNPNNQIEKIFKMSGLYEIMPKIS